jgi:hypothetical protein
MISHDEEISLVLVLAITARRISFSLPLLLSKEPSLTTNPNH